MKSIKKVLLCGFLDWLLPFALSFFIFPLKESNYSLFESIMTVIIVLSAVLFSVLYFKIVDKNYIKEGLLLGIVWLVINLIIDLVLFLSPSPMRMSFSLYMSQIGIKYFTIPVITLGMGYVLKNKNS